MLGALFIRPSSALKYHAAAWRLWPGVVAASAQQHTNRGIAAVGVKLLRRADAGASAMMAAASSPQNAIGIWASHAREPRVR